MAARHSIRNGINLYIAGSDSLAIYTLRNDPPVIDFVANQHQNLLVGHQSIYDSITDKLYDIYKDQKKVIPFDFKSAQWKEDFAPGAAITEFWHANKFISVVDSSLYIIAGYGQLRYKNEITRYHFPQKHGSGLQIWATVFRQDISPRWEQHQTDILHIF
ncbi:MAG: hypothetical protein WDM78_13345 [Puia sp.]